MEKNEQDNMKELINPFFPNVSFSFDTLKKRKPKVL